ncbi:MAG: hypothetical protein ACLSFL_09810, partial [Faecalibacterium sp.]
NTQLRASETANWWNIILNKVSSKSCTASPSPSRLAACHLSQSERLWHYGQLSGSAKGSPFGRAVEQM